MNRIFKLCLFPMQQLNDIQRGAGLVLCVVLLFTGIFPGKVYGESQIGLNKVELLQQFLGTASKGDGSVAYRKVTQAMAEKSLDDARAIGAGFVRVAVAGMAPVQSGQRGDLDLWQKDPDAYWKIMDQMMDALQTRAIKIVPVFVWNLGQFPAMNNERVDALLLNQNSKSWKLLESYVSQFVTRYRNYKGILFYELGNEFNIPVDLDINKRCETTQIMICGVKANFSSADVIGFTKRLANLIRSIDGPRKISSGFAVPRPAAEHLRQRPELAGKPDWTVDKVSDLERNLAEMNQYVDIISVHLYPVKENQRFGAGQGEEFRLLQVIKQAADRIGKPLFVGEFGDMDARIAGPGGFSDRMLNQVVNLNIEYAAMWGWQLYIKNPYTSYDTVHTLSSLEPGYTDYLIGRFRQTASRLGSHSQVPSRQASISPHVVLTWPLECSKISEIQTIHAVASDSGDPVERVDFLINGEIVGTKATPPYQVSWNAHDRKSGEYLLVARAYARGGNMAEYATKVLVNAAKVAGSICSAAE